MAHRMGGADVGREIGSATTTSIQSTTSTTNADITGATFTGNFDGGPIVIDWGAWAQIQPTAAGAGVSLTLQEDGVNVDVMRADGPVAGLNVNYNLFKTTRRTPSAGSHTYKVVFRVTAAGTGTIQASSQTPAGIVSIRSC